jgi:ribosomal protein L27
MGLHDTANRNLGSRNHDQTVSCDGNPLVDERTGARHADGRLGGLGSEHCLEGIPATADATVLFQPKQKLNQTKQIRKYIFMENIFYQLGSNSHPEGMRHC